MRRAAGTRPGPIRQPSLPAASAGVWVLSAPGSAVTTVRKCWPLSLPTTNVRDPGVRQEVTSPEGSTFRPGSDTRGRVTPVAVTGLAGAEAARVAAGVVRVGPAALAATGRP